MNGIDLSLGASIPAAAVVGSFVGDDRGELMASSMPDLWSDAVLGRTLSRVAKIMACAASCGLDASHCELTLSGRRLFVMRFPGGILCVLAAAAADRGALLSAMRRLALDLPFRFDALDAAEAEESEVTARLWQAVAAALPNAQSP